MAMKRLMLLRHAQTLPADGISDIERKLTPNGIADAKALGASMKAKGYQPDFIFCSAARRTQETLDHLMASLDDCLVEIDAKIYHGSRGDLFHIIQNAKADVSSILIIGHNPTMHETAATFAENSSQTLVNKLMSHYMPGTLTVLDCPCENWTDIQAGANPIVDLLEPLDYNAPSTPARWT